MFGTRWSVSIPIAAGVFSVGLSLALLVGWILIIASALAETGEVGRHAWLLILGCISFLVIITALVLFSVFLAREVRLVNRQTRFIDSVTHELKSPLASLKLCLQTLERSGISPAQQGEIRHMMVDDIRRLSNFIDDVLEASQLSATRSLQTSESVELEPVVARQAMDILRQYKLPADAIRAHVPAGLLLVTDRTALETILKNLLDNAVKYSLDLDHPVEVEVDAFRRANRVHLSIRDRGIGIPKRHLRRVFDRFFRVPDIAVKRRHGTGLGLYVASALARLLGGTVRAESTEGQGTVVRLAIPIRARGSRSAARRKPRCTEPAA